LFVCCFSRFSRQRLPVHKMRLSILDKPRSGEALKGSQQSTGCCDQIRPSLYIGQYLASGRGLFVCPLFQSVFEAKAPGSQNAAEHFGRAPQRRSPERVATVHRLLRSNPANGKPSYRPVLLGSSCACRQHLSCYDQMMLITGYYFASGRWLRVRAPIQWLQSEDRNNEETGSGCSGRFAAVNGL